jgi:hypothetical protein
MICSPACSIEMVFKYAIRYIINSIARYISGVRIA